MPAWIICLMRRILLSFSFPILRLHFRHLSNFVLPEKRMKETEGSTIDDSMIRMCGAWKDLAYKPICFTISLFCVFPSNGFDQTFCVKLISSPSVLAWTLMKDGTSDCRSCAFRPWEEIAASYDVVDGPNDEGEPRCRDSSGRSLEVKVSRPLLNGQNAKCCWSRHQNLLRSFVQM